MIECIELYGANTGNSLRAAISLAEAGVPFFVRRLDLRAGDQNKPDYLKLNPAGKVPTLVDNTYSPPLIINQSNAIIHYADAKVPNHLMPSEPGPTRLRVYDRFFYFVTDVIATSHAGFFLHQLDLNEAARPLDERALENMKRAEAFLEGDFIAGDAFSMADIAAFTWALSVKKQLPWKQLPRMKRWFEVMSERPGVRIGLQAFQD